MSYSDESLPESVRTSPPCPICGAAPTSTIRSSWEYGCWDATHVIYGCGETLDEARERWIEITEKAMAYVGERA